VAQVETPTTTRAKELLDLYRALSTPITNAADTDNRLEVLLRVKVHTETDRHSDAFTHTLKRTHAHTLPSLIAFPFSLPISLSLSPSSRPLLSSSQATVREFNDPLTRDISDLVDREGTHT
jgi:hypothetical protein